MDRITGPDVDADLFGVGKDGFKDPDIGLDAATTVNADWLNAMQEETLGVIEGAGVVPDATSNAQLLRAINTMLGMQAVSNMQTRTGGGGFAGTVNGLVWSGSLWVAVGVDSTADVQTSPDGITWTHRTHSGFNGGSDYFSDVAWNGSVFCAVGRLGEIQTSPTGTTWTHRTADASYAGVFYAITWNGSVFCAVGSSGEVQTSPTGTTWTHRSTTGGSNLHDVAWSSALSLFVAVGDAGYILTSPTGTTWTVRTGSFGDPNSFGGVDCVGSTLCAVGGDGAAAIVMTSSDGITWTSRTPEGSYTSLKGIAASADFFVTVGAGGAIQASGDGRAWTSLPILGATSNYAAVAFGGRSFIASAPSGVIKQSLFL